MTVHCHGYLANTQRLNLSEMPHENHPNDRSQRFCTDWLCERQ